MLRHCCYLSLRAGGLGRVSLSLQRGCPSLHVLTLERAVVGSSLVPIGTLLLGHSIRYARLGATTVAGVVEWLFITVEGC